MGDVTHDGPMGVGTTPHPLPHYHSHFRMSVACSSNKEVNIFFSTNRNNDNESLNTWEIFIKLARVIKLWSYS